MAERKPLFLGTQGFNTEFDPASDSMTLGGLTMGGNVNLSSSARIVDCLAGTASGDVLVYGQSGGSLQDLTITGTVTNATDAATKAYTDSTALSGASVKEAILIGGQLDNTAGIVGAVALTLQNNAANDDRVVLTDGTTTRTYYFGTGTGDVQVTIGANSSISMDNLRAAINGDGSAIWGATYYATGLGSIDADGILVIREDATSGSASKIYGTNWGAGECQIVDFGGETDYTKQTLTDIPSSVPGSTNFGFRRTVANLSNGEIHNTLYNDVLYYWDDDSDTWIEFSGAGAIATATGSSGGGTKGKATFDTDYGLEVTSGVVGMNLATNGGLQFTSGDLQVKVASADELSVTASGLVMVGLPSLFKIGGTAVGATVTTANLDDLVDGSNADSLHVHTSAGISINHSDIGTVTENQHHNRQHVITGADHTVSGLTAGHVLTATSATTFAFQTPAEATAMQREENTATTATDATTNGDPVYVNGNDTVGKADASADAKARITGVIRTGAGAAGASVEVVDHGRCASILSSATVNTPYYLASGGGLTTTKPSTSGDRVICVGYAMNATDLFVQIHDYGKVA